MTVVMRHSMVQNVKLAHRQHKHAPMDIRPATSFDADAISALISSVMHHLTLHPDGRGAEQFIASLAPAAIAATIASPNMRYLACFDGGALAGVVAMRDQRHLYHLFVAPAFQRRGLATRLWHVARDEALAHGNPGAFTVNSSILAIPLYQSLGFRAAAGRIEEKGIAYLPMELRSPDM